MHYNLFLDDIRSAKDVKRVWSREGWIDFPSTYTWIVVRSYREFVETILRDGLPDRISIDHDLSYEDINKTMDFKEKTGFDCVKWLTDYCLAKNLKLPEWYVHSLNPVGRQNIISLLDTFDGDQKTS